MNAIVCHGFHVFLQHVILILPLNNVSENQYRLRDFLLSVVIFFQCVPACQALAVYQYLKMYCSHIDTFIHVNLSTIFGVNI